MLEYFAKIPATNKADGTKNRQTDMLMYFGNLPDDGSFGLPTGYKTKLANNGPRHVIAPDIRLGDLIMPETDGFPQMIPIDNDCLDPTLLFMDPEETTFTVKVKTFNQTGKVANLYGWIDFNGDGKFNNNEAAETAVHPNTQEATLTFTKTQNLSLAEGSFGLRLRFTTDNLIRSNLDPAIEDIRSFGSATNGEVEDYSFSIKGRANISAQKSTNKTNAVTDEVITYSITVTNNGSKDAKDVIIKDKIDSGIAVVPGSFFLINGSIITPLPSDVNIENGINIGSIEKKGVRVLTFKVKVL